MRSLPAWRAGLALAVIAPAGFLAATALSSPGGRLADPVTATTFTDAASDYEARAPDIEGGTVESYADGSLRFTIALPHQTSMIRGDGIGVFLDVDRVRSTGDQGNEFLLAVDGKSGLPPAIEVYAWSGVVWSRVVAGGLSGRFDPGGGVVLEVDRSLVKVDTAFNFVVRTSWVGAASVLYHDYAPNPPEFFTFQLTPPPATTTAATTTTPKPPAPKTQRLTGRVGPGATISLTRRATAGKAEITVSDLSAKDDFHLTGPRVDKRTGVAFKGVVKWTVTLRKGAYTFRSDAHASLRGTLTVS